VEAEIMPPKANTKDVFREAVFREVRTGRETPFKLKVKENKQEYWRDIIAKNTNLLHQAKLRQTNKY